jgi:hypothetical protein
MSAGEGRQGGKGWARQGHGNASVMDGARFLEMCRRITSVL